MKYRELVGVQINNLRFYRFFSLKKSKKLKSQKFWTYVTLSSTYFSLVLQFCKLLQENSL